LTIDDKNRVVKTLRKILKAKGFSINLSGKFKNDNEFRLIDKITFGIYIQGGGSPAVLKGKFSNNSDKNNLTIISRSHYIFPLASLFIITVGLPMMLIDDMNDSKEKIISILGSFLIAFICNSLGNYYKNRLLKKTVKELGLIKR